MSENFRNFVPDFRNTTDKHKIIQLWDSLAKLLSMP